MASLWITFNVAAVRVVPGVAFVVFACLFFRSEVHQATAVFIANAMVFLIVGSMLPLIVRLLCGEAGE